MQGSSEDLCLELKIMTLGKLAGQPGNKSCSSEWAKRTAVEGKGQEVCVPRT